MGGACGLISASASALELGEIQVQSSLGQPLRASIAYALNPTEQLASYCIYLRPGNAEGGLPSLSRARVSVGNGVITLSGSKPIREPLLAMQMTVNCPYTAHLARNYTLMFNPAEAPAAAAGTERTSRHAEGRPQSPAAGKRATAPTRPQVSDAPAAITASSRYQVQPGDSLSAIVARIPNRSVGLWPAVDALFAANTEAFIDGDRNLLKAGSWLTIPALDGVVTRAPAASANIAAAAEPETTASAYAGFTEPLQEQLGEAVAPPPEVTPEPMPDTTPVAHEIPEPAAISGAVPDSGASLEPQIDDPFVAELRPAAATATSADNAVIAVPPASETRKIVRRAPVVSNQPVSAATGTRTNSWALLAWLGGSGIALFVGLLVFGRNLRDLFGSAPAGATAETARSRRAGDQAAPPAVRTDLDFPFSDAASSDESFTLDADLGEGSGLLDGSGIEVVQDFGFPVDGDADGAIDLELPEAQPAGPDQQTAEMVRPDAPEASAIRASRSAAPDESAEYNLSMIVDATRQSIGESDETAKDLMAVQADDAGEDLENGQYTLSQEVDYEVIEQDYEEELTATHAISEELAKAAFDLAHASAEDEGTAETREMPTAERISDTGSTAEITAQLASDAELTAEMTSALPMTAEAENEEFLSDLDDTGINEELTAEMPPAFDEATAEMEIEGGRIDTKRSKAS